MSDTFDELRIIAKDARGMDKIDRDVLRRAADELEDTARQLVETQAKLIESQNQRIALNERLLETRPKAKHGAFIQSITWGNFNLIPMVPD